MMLSEDDRSKDTDPHFVRACAVERHFNVSQEPRDTENYRKNAAPQNEPRTRTHILCERAQSIHMSIFHKNHLLRKFTGKMLRRRLCASLCSRNECQHFTRTTLYGNLQENAAPKNRGADFVRACTVETHVNISQEPLYTENCKEKARDQSEHPDQAPAFTPTVRTPLCGHTIWGLKKLSILCFLRVVSNCRRGRLPLSFSIFKAGTEAAITKPSHHSPRDFMRASREFGSQLSERARPPPVSLGLALPRSARPAAAACECA